MLPDRPQTTSEKQLRKSLGEHFGVDMTERKGQIRELVTAYLSQVRRRSGREGRGAVQQGVRCRQRCACGIKVAQTEEHTYHAAGKCVSACSRGAAWDRRHSCQLEARMYATGAAVPHMPRVQGAPAWFKQKREGEEAEKRAAEEAAWRAERERKRREREERERKARGGKVVVVGAGPAGLTAALHLKVKRRGGEN